jgi:hypothetical protein
MTVRIFEIDAPTAVVVVDLALFRLRGVGPIPQTPPTNPRKDLVELLFIDQESVVLGRDFLVDLKVRPIRHRVEARVKAHIFLSMLAYYVQWHMIEAWAPLTFKDEAGDDAVRLADPVAPARRSEAALAKVHTRTLADGTPAMSFTRLLAHLATIVRNTLRPRSARPGETTFSLTTRPTPKQQQALDLVAAIKPASLMFDLRPDPHDPRV